MVQATNKDKDLVHRENFSMYQVGYWIQTMKLQLAAQKTEAVILKGTKGAKIREQIKFNVENLQIAPSKSIKYLAYI